ncbi:MAG: TM2 domain-containing protein [Candidatus Dadabacteria bacterium]|nr:TM2 domain-containing protein [Nitrosopumilaceae archaeon]NIS08920.1 TM2 domain-containing protein [Candidatus Dadabacteria bacterium]NIT99698.1 TM2 domain-containing protein [Nitrosopumilaceae archaeon]NIU86091.1 NINE protein [Nitrosopumilaceae archaeon]NIV64835.1 NINE protein [Nitrosopumilaceae archaeon]
MDYLPELEGDEAAYISKVMESMDEKSADRFSKVYRARRQDPQTVLLTALVGFFGVAGIHRFLVGQLGMGLLYLFTAGLCFIGTIVDIINYKNLAFEYNREVAREAVSLIE